MTYNVKYTDSTKPAIVIPEGVVDTSLDVVLFGRVDLEYGQQLNQDMLNVLERFACPQDSTSTKSHTFPDFTINGHSLENPTQGQLWYNSTVQKLFVWNGSNWEGLRSQGDVAGNWGQIYDGGQIPQPINFATGQPYPYSQCIWAVSPASFPSAFTYMECTTDINAVVTMKYRAYGDSAFSASIANYMIIAITGNVNNGTVDVTPQNPSVSNTPTPTPPVSVTPTISHTPFPSPTPAVTHTATVSPTAVVSPTAGITPSVTASLTRTPATSITPSPAALSATASVYSVAGTVSGTPSGAARTATAGPNITITPVGGVAPYVSFVWSVVSGVASQAVGTQAPYTGQYVDIQYQNVIPSPGSTTTYTSVMRCAVTDSAGNVTYTPNINCSFSFRNTGDS